MKQFFLNIIFCLACILMQSQKEFHVTISGTSLGNGSIDQPWDLQTALNQKAIIVNGGDTIWLHEGVYQGRYVSNLSSSIKNKKLKI